MAVNPAVDLLDIDDKERDKSRPPVKNVSTFLDNPERALRRGSLEGGMTKTIQGPVSAFRIPCWPLGFRVRVRGFSV